MKINLHIHSKYSLNSLYDVNKIIDIFEKNKFDIISITDHNILKCYKNLKIKSSIKIITGIEADATINGCTYDFLCYGFDLKKVENFVNDTYHTLEVRQQKIYEIMLKLCQEKQIIIMKSNGYDFTKKYAHAMIFEVLPNDFLKKYNINNVTDFYRLSTTDKKFPLYYDMNNIWPKLSTLLATIHECGGKVFLAHPYRYKKRIDDVLSDIKGLVDGIEIGNRNTKEEIDYLYNYAKNNNLLISVGSDFHSEEDDILPNNINEKIIKEVLKWVQTY